MASGDRAHPRGRALFLTQEESIASVPEAAFLPLICSSVAGSRPPATWLWRWTPHVTLGVRLVSVLDDDMQHVGQAAYLRGILLRRG